MSIMIWFTALLALITGTLAFAVGILAQNPVQLGVGSVLLLLAVVQARYGFARILHAFAHVVEEAEHERH